MFDCNITYINIYGPNSADKAFFETLNKYLAESEKDEFIIGGYFNTVLEPDVDKIGGISITHAKSRETIKTAMDSFDLNDIWNIIQCSLLGIHQADLTYIQY